MAADLTRLTREFRIDAGALLLSALGKGGPPP
jgi:hypothetical protein